MTQTRLERLADRRTHERVRRLRGVVVVLALLAVAFVVPFGRAPSPDGDAVAQRLAAVQLEREAVEPAEEVARERSPEVEAAVAEPVAQLIPLTEAPELFLPLGRVAIPRIGVDMPIRNGVHERILEQGVGQWPGTDAGNTVLSGHRTTYLHPFGDLDLLVPDDEVVLTLGGGAPRSYRVFETRIVSEDEYVDVVLSGTPEPDDAVVTMYACHPKGQRTHRIVVRARAV